MLGDKLHSICIVRLNVYKISVFVFFSYLFLLKFYKTFNSYINIQTKAPDYLEPFHEHLRLGSICFYSNANFRGKMLSQVVNELFIVYLADSSRIFNIWFLV